MNQEDFEATVKLVEENGELLLEVEEENTKVWEIKGRLIISINYDNQLVMVKKLEDGLLSYLQAKMAIQTLSNNRKYGNLPQTVPITFYDKGKPVSTSFKESDRLAKRTAIICDVLVEMGYSTKEKIINEYNEIITKLAEEDFDKYMDFNKKVQEIAHEQGC